MAISPRPEAHSRGGKVASDLGVAQHRPRLPESPDQILALGQVDPGLSADGRIDLGQQRGGDVHVGGAPVEGCRREPGQVGDDAAPHGDDDVGTAEAAAGEPPAQILDHAERLGLLAVGNGEPVERDPGVDRHVDPVLGDHRRPNGPGHGRGHHLGQPVTGAGPDRHLVATVPQLDRHDGHAGPPATIPPPDTAGSARILSTT